MQCSKLNYIQLALQFWQFSAAVVHLEANDDVVMRPERGLLHCLEWYKLVMRTLLIPTPAAWRLGQTRPRHGRSN